MALRASGILPDSLAVAKATAADFQSTDDQAFTWLVPVPAKYVIRRVVANQVSGATSVACLGGVYTAASKGGSALIAAAQSWLGLSGSGKIVDATLAAIATTNVVTSSTLYLSLSTGSTAACTADVYIYADILT